MKIKSFIFFSYFILLPFLVISQTWPKIYINPGTHTSGKVAYESYDNGIILLAENLGQYGLRTSGWLIKTDINGNVLWDRVIGRQEQYLSLTNNMEATSDSGVVIAMSTRFFEQDPFGFYNDPVFIKLNKCGQLDWCTLISLLGTGNSGTDVVQTNDGFIGLYYNLNVPNNDIGVVKMNLNGQIQWLFTYDSDTIVDNIPCDILALDDGSTIVTGFGYYDNGQSTYVSLKPVKLHIAPDGGVINWQVMHYDNDSLRGVDYETIKDNRGNLFSAGSTITTQTYPYNYDKKTLRKQKVNGSNLEYYIQDESKSINGYLCWMVDSTIAITGASEIFENNWWRYPSDVSIIDTFGNVINNRILLDDYWGSVYRVSTTHDNKILATGSADAENPYGPPGNTFLFKLTSTLEDDVYDPTPRVYDYACPGGVAPHDTIGMEECDIVVSAAHLATLPDIAVMEVYPNPVNDVFQVRLPEFIAIRNNNKGLNTALYQSNYQQQSVLQVFDLSGRFISEQKLTQGQLIAQFDASHWVPGMYLLRLVYKDKTVGSAKVVR
ncbi:MAG: T9SS type A sorting domain-containing protein [Lentimicrobium sp.]|uniref:T9SS type A sorting domain-containing protein n=1 Tax=Lentimicrobium sp. TaxID=2034841 RepID=UPI002B200E16|nr:T9SS type A sorting domain-containing protein [Lentimicrobium sp.]MEA5111782.1 T9SS type A sorting domain-containing protein [Lentimicrobium sp.]